MTTTIITRSGFAVKPRAASWPRELTEQYVDDSLRLTEVERAIGKLSTREANQRKRWFLNFASRETLVGFAKGPQDGKRPVDVSRLEPGQVVLPVWENAPANVRPRPVTLLKLVGRDKRGAKWRVRDDRGVEHEAWINPGSTLGPLPLSQTVIPFGPFNGLTLARILDLREGDVVARFTLLNPKSTLLAATRAAESPELLGKVAAGRAPRPTARFATADGFEVESRHVELDATKDFRLQTTTLVFASDEDLARGCRRQGLRLSLGRPFYAQVPLFADPSGPVWHTAVDSHTEGVRYLDRLLDGEWGGWLYPETYARIALFLTHPAARGERTVAYSNYVSEHSEGDALWVVGHPLDDLAQPTYGDGRDLRPSDFGELDQQGRDVRQYDRWGGQSRERLARRGAGGRPADDDPADGRFVLVDAVRFARGKARDQDAWEDFRVTPLNDLEWDWEPPAADADGTVQWLPKPRTVRTPAEARVWVRGSQGGYKRDDSLRVVSTVAAVREKVTVGGTDARAVCVVRGKGGRREATIVHDANPASEAEVVKVVTRSFAVAGQVGAEGQEQVSHAVWAHAIRLIEALERCGSATERPYFQAVGGDRPYRERRQEWEDAVALNPAGQGWQLDEPREWFERIEDLKAEGRRLLLVPQGDGSAAWHPLVPAKIRLAVVGAIDAAQKRLEQAFAEEQAAYFEAKIHAECEREARAEWLERGRLAAQGLAFHGEVEVGAETFRVYDGLVETDRGRENRVVILNGGPEPVARFQEPAATDRLVEDWKAWAAASSEVVEELAAD